MTARPSPPGDTPPDLFSPGYRFYISDGFRHQCVSEQAHSKEEIMVPRCIGSKIILPVLVILGLSAGADNGDSTASRREAGSRVQILAINDFHGHIGSKKSLDGRLVGSAPVLAAYLEHERRVFEGETFIVHAGDLVGASPPQSALLQDEPTILFFNALGGEKCRIERNHPQCRLIGIPGNHAFDEGIREFLRLINGGNHPDGPFLTDPYGGAEFPVVCANIRYKKDSSHVFPPYVIRNVQGAQIAFIGAVLKETPTMVTPGGVSTLCFEDEVTAVNRAIEQIVQKRIRAIILLIHQGGEQQPYNGWTRRNTDSITGPIVDIVENLH